LYILPQSLLKDINKSLSLDKRGPLIQRAAPLSLYRRPITERYFRLKRSGEPGFSRTGERRRELLTLL
jgi:hypothetical protein